MQFHQWDHVQEAVARVRRQYDGRPIAGIVLGTGLGGVAREIEPEAQIDYAEIPHFPRSTAPGHHGRLLLGRLGDVPVAAMEGRFHLYEGYTAAQVTFPIRVLRALGCESLIVSNAAGGLNPGHGKGDIVVIDDHINLMGVNPLIGPNDERLGPRFPDMCWPYDRELQERFLGLAREANVRAHRGVYAGVIGPNLETRAEYRALRVMGADVVGMSTVPEVLVAVHARMRVLGCSIVTDLCLPDSLQPVRLEEILAVAAEAESRLRPLVKRFVATLN